MIIANVSPSMLCGQETLSTLYFVRGAKRIRNRATVNMDTRGDTAILQKEINRLNAELDAMRKGQEDTAAAQARCFAVLALHLHLDRWARLMR